MGCDELERKDGGPRDRGPSPQAAAGLLADGSQHPSAQEHKSLERIKVTSPSEPALDPEPGATDILKVTVRGDTVGPFQHAMRMVPTSPALTPRSPQICYPTALTCTHKRSSTRTQRTGW